MREFLFISMSKKILLRRILNYIKIWMTIIILVVCQLYYILYIYYIQFKILYKVKHFAKLQNTLWILKNLIFYCMWKTFRWKKPMRQINLILILFSILLVRTGLCLYLILLSSSWDPCLYPQKKEKYIFV